MREPPVVQSQPHVPQTLMFWVFRRSHNSLRSYVCCFHIKTIFNAFTDLLFDLEVGTLDVFTLLHLCIDEENANVSTLSCYGHQRETHPRIVCCDVSGKQWERGDDHL